MEKSEVTKNLISNDRNPRTIGFLPSYLPNGSLNTNSSSINLSSSCTFTPSIEIKVNPPTPTEELLKCQFSSFNSMNSSKVPSTSENSNKITATAPSINEINYKTGLTCSERNDILKEFSTLSNNKYKIDNELEFQAAQGKIIQLLSIAESRLTKNEKDDFMRQLNNIIAKRQNWLKRKSERKNRKTRRDNLVISIIFLQIVVIVS